MRLSAVLVAVFACCLLAATGCARPPDVQNQEKTSGQVDETAGDQALELPKPELARYGGPNWPPPVWLVSAKEAVQASYGEFCMSDMCGGEVVPQQIGGDPATAELPAGDPVMVVVGRAPIDDLAVVHRLREQPARPGRGG
jgi:hypothetical protein